MALADANGDRLALSPQTSFLLVREDAKAAVLLHLLRTVVRPQDQTVVFVATKHHAEYLTEVSGCRAVEASAARHCTSERGQQRAATPRDMGLVRAPAQTNPDLSGWKARELVAWVQPLPAAPGQSWFISSPTSVLRV